jgi:hypothetical protein
MMAEGSETKEGVIEGKEYRYPHCDSYVLHAPGECRYCDAYPQRQAARVEAGINFTGHHDPDKEVCPAEARRPVERINLWAGNVPKPEGEPADINPITGLPRASAPPRLKRTNGHSPDPYK